MILLCGYIGKFLNVTDKILKSIKNLLYKKARMNIGAF